MDGLAVLNAAKLRALFRGSIPDGQATSDNPSCEWQLAKNLTSFYRQVRIQFYFCLFLQALSKTGKEKQKP